MPYYFAIDIHNRMQVTSFVTQEPIFNQFAPSHAWKIPILGQWSQHTVMTVHCQLYLFLWVHGLLVLWFCLYVPHHLFRNIDSSIDYIISPCSSSIILVIFIHIIIKHDKSSSNSITVDVLICCILIGCTFEAFTLAAKSSNSICYCFCVELVEFPFLPQFYW